MSIPAYISQALLVCNGLMPGPSMLPQQWACLNSSERSVLVGAAQPRSAAERTQHWLLRVFTFGIFADDSAIACCALTAAFLGGAVRSVPDGYGIYTMSVNYAAYCAHHTVRIYCALCLYSRELW
jgi:hypothetical protein